jgi:hypothetical protein
MRGHLPAAVNESTADWVASKQVKTWHRIREILG